MAGYIEGLGPDATMGTIFDDLYSKVDAVVKELKEQKLEGPDPQSTVGNVPVMSLQFERVGVRGYGNSTYLSACYGYERAHLLGVSTLTGTAEGSPSRVCGYRGDESSPDFTLGLNLDRRGQIECRLGRMGLRSRLEVVDEPPRGTLSANSTDKLQNVKGDDRRRLEVVAGGILDNLTVVGLIQDGADPLEALDIMGKRWLLESH